MGEWISVKKKLPENWDLYLCYCEQPWLAKIEQKPYMQSGGSHYILVEWFPEKNKFNIDERVEITHWMQLTKPTNEVE